jgi:hypothetical protein
MPVSALHLARLERYLKVAKAAGAAGNIDAAKKIMMMYLYFKRKWQTQASKRQAFYLSAQVRQQGIWRDWRRAGLQHLTDNALIRFCGLPKSAVFELATLAIQYCPTLAPASKVWRNTGPTRPACDILDVVVLKLRELATVGYQHQLCTDMGIGLSSVCKYLRMGKTLLTKVLEKHSAARFGLLGSYEIGLACMDALESQHGECPRSGLLFVYAIDGTVTKIRPMVEEELKTLWWCGSKGYYGHNTILLVSPLGTIHAYNAALPGCFNDTRAAADIMASLASAAKNPHKFGTLADYGFSIYCTHDAGSPPVVRPFCAGKDKRPSSKEARHAVARFSAWVTSCRQHSECTSASSAET